MNPATQNTTLSEEEIRSLISRGILVPTEHARRWMQSRGMDTSGGIPMYNQQMSTRGYVLNPAVAYGGGGGGSRPAPAPAKQNRMAFGGGNDRIDQLLKFAQANGNLAAKPTSVVAPNSPATPAPPAAPPPMPQSTPVAPPRTSPPMTQMPQAPAPYQPPSLLVPPSQQNQNPWWLMPGLPWTTPQQPQPQPAAVAPRPQAPPTPTGAWTNATPMTNAQAQAALQALRQRIGA